MRNRRVSRGLAPTSGQQSEPAPTTGTLSTCRRRCSVGFARVGVRKGGAREPHRSLPASGTSGGFLDPMGASDFDPAAVRAQARFPRPALVRRFPGLCFSRVTSVPCIPVQQVPRRRDAQLQAPTSAVAGPRAGVPATAEWALPSRGDVTNAQPHKWGQGAEIPIIEAFCRSELPAPTCGGGAGGGGST